MSSTLLFIASITLLVVPVLYLVKTYQGKIVPNPVTFFLRALISVLNLVTYFKTNGGDHWKSSVTVVSAIGLTLIFFFSLKWGKLDKIKWIDIVAAAIALGALAIGKHYRDPVIANLFLQVAMFIPFAVAVRGVVKEGLLERVLPWSLATLAYVFMTAGLYVRGDCTWQEFIHPVCVGILGNGWLAASVAWMNSKKK